MSNLKQIKLSEFSEIVSGYAFKSVDFTREGIPVIKIGNIGNGEVDLDPGNTQYLPEGIAESVHRKYRVSRGDILISLTGSHMTQPLSVVGRVARYRHDFESMLNQRAGKVVITDHGRMTIDYLYYLLSTRSARMEIALLAHGAANQANVSPKDIPRLKFHIEQHPDSQRKVAAILAAYDDLIGTNNGRIALLEQMAEQLYREWFVRMRFPGHSSVEVVKGVPNGWCHVLLQKAFKFTGGGTPSKAEGAYWSDGTVNWYTPTDITGSKGVFLNSSTEKCTEEAVSRSSARIFPAYSVMMTSRATIGAIGINTTPACTNQGFITCIPNDRYPLTFLYHWLKLAKPHFELLAGGATFAELTKTTFNKMKILTPSKTLVARYEQIAKPIFKQIETLQRIVENLAISRDRLLVRLIAGNLCVHNLDIQFPANMMEKVADDPQ